MRSAIWCCVVLSGEERDIFETELVRRASKVREKGRRRRRRRRRKWMQKDAGCMQSRLCEVISHQ